MDQEFYYHQSMPVRNAEVDEQDKTEVDIVAEKDDVRAEYEGGEYLQEEPFRNHAYINDMYHQCPAPYGSYGYWNDGWIRASEDAIRRPHTHGGGRRPRPGFHGSGAPFLGGLASGLLFGSLLPFYGGYPYGGYGGFYPYYYQQPYYPYYPYPY